MESPLYAVANYSLTLTAQLTIYFAQCLYSSALKPSGGQAWVRPRDTPMASDLAVPQHITGLYVHR